MNTFASPVISSFVSYPFQTVMVRMQMEADAPWELRKYKSIVECFVKIIKEEGVMGGLYLGFFPSVLINLLINSLSRPAKTTKSSLQKKD